MKRKARTQRRTRAFRRKIEQETQKEECLQEKICCKRRKMSRFKVFHIAIFLYKGMVPAALLQGRALGGGGCHGIAAF